MKLDRIETEMFDALAEMPVIDAHEHLRPEAERVARKVDFFLLFSTYCRADLCSAGMAPEVYDRLRDDPEMDVAAKWKAFEPFYPMIRHGSYARPARIWLREVLGFDDLTKQNYQAVSAGLQEWNVPGLYDRVLREMCHVRTALVANDTYQEYDFGLLKPLWRLISFTGDGRIGDFLAARPEGAVKPIEEYLEWMEQDLERYLQRGRAGVKAICFPFETPDLKRADGIFRSLQAPGGRTLTGAERATLTSAIYDRALGLAERHGLTVAVHSGVWGDFRESQPTYLIPMATRHPGVSFDLFHLGMPFVREAVMIGKMFPNVSLNLCWNTVVSPELTFRMLDECLDLVPINDLIAFGGDYNLPVEKVYGHLKMTQEVVARVLAKRIRREEMDAAEALRIAGMWFHDNAVRIYGL